MGNKKSIASIQKHIEALRKDRDVRLRRLDAQIVEAETNKFNQAYTDELKKQKENIENIYSNFLSRAKTELKSLQDAEGVEQAKLLEIRRQATEQLKNTLKTRWIEAGGTPEVFEDNWPQLHATYLSKKVLSSIRDDDNSKETPVNSPAGRL